MPTVYVNNEPVEIGAEERLNCIQAAQRAGVEIPSYCWHPALSVVASCRMCLVEIGQKKPDGTVAMDGEAGARLSAAGEGRDGDRCQQREGEGGAAGDARVSAAQSSARLPDVRSGGRVLFAGL